MSIYDKFVKDEEWQRTNTLLHLPDLTYRERDALRAKMDTIEDRIRKADKAEWEKLIKEHKQKTNGEADAVRDKQA